MPSRVTFSAVSRVPARWAGDSREAENIMPFGLVLDPAQFNKADSVVVTLTAAASINAVTLTVAALSGPIPAGTVLDFAGTGLLAKTAAAAALGATSISTIALDKAIPDTTVATYPGDTAKAKSIPSGIAVGRTLAERTASTPFGPAINTDDEIYLLAFEVVDADREPFGEAYRLNRVVKETFLPQWGNVAFWPTTLVTVLRTKYVFITGRA